MKTTNFSIPSSFLLDGERITRLLQQATGGDRPNYPPVDIYRTGENWTVQIAVAGYSRPDLSVEIDADHQLVVKGTKPDRPVEPGTESVSIGISRRAFERRWQMNEWMEIESAKLADGILTVNVKESLPLPKQSKTIAITFD